MPSPTIKPSREFAELPLCVSLDGALVQADTLSETAVAAVKKQPWLLLLFPFWLMRGRSYFEQQIWERSPVRVKQLPMQEEFISYLRAEAATGRRMVLVTDGHGQMAESVASLLPLFEAVVSNGEPNRWRGSAKLDAIQRAVNGQPFVYAGNSEADFPVWRAAAGAIVVTGSRSYPARLAELGKRVLGVFPVRPLSFGVLVRALRAHQWAKNLLVFVPVGAGHQVLVGPVLWQAGLSFLSFSACASALYLMNDLLDLEADRAHPRKRHRPLAAGTLPVLGGVALMVCCALVSIAIATQLPAAASAWLAVYAATTLAYSWKWKRLLLLDVVLLASFYALRMLFGGAATGITISVWTLAFALFLFLCLALVKRLVELHVMVGQGLNTVAGRAYVAADLPLVAAMAAASGYLSVLVLALYIHSPEVVILYSRPQALWLLCPLMVYWISRLLVLANRGGVDDDPVLYALRDRASYVVALLGAVIILAAI